MLLNPFADSDEARLGGLSYLSLLEIRRDGQIRVEGLSMKNETEGERRRYKMVIYEAGELTKDVPCLGGDDGLMTGMNLVFARSLGVNRSWCEGLGDEDEALLLL